MTTSYTQLLEEARERVSEVTVEEVKNRIERGEHWTVLDVREREEYRAGTWRGRCRSRGDFWNCASRRPCQTKAPRSLPTAPVACAH
jgi:hypothetical protein